MPEVLDKNTIKALSTDTRQEIMKMLAKRPYTASEISKITSRHVTTVTEHLEVLEKSGLIRRKDSTNKWVYYELSDKGEHLFKPQFYSWVVVLSLSALFIFIGSLRIVDTNLYASAGSQADTVMTPMATPLLSIQDTSAQDASKNERSTASEPATIAAESAAGADLLGICLVAIGAAGFGYLGIRKYQMIKSVQRI
jgi:DNA-binding transcriptional ArsR family regulator